ncbi:hypothetical protein [Actinacidiphila sp. ITFR-21]|uniref:hypothetical protein n=1 Tax=Actinacidiphila sp. ITFR-21 TaxID=3075199 RepID=UPI002889E173|nr:hypothetical protein [Streptomyces sp. ITFR-21]WNI16938.1 hypothetical protein RLT57_16340 [Streptomyces sp. ITFR-21]
MNVNDLVQIRIADAARRIEAAKRRRAEMDAARRRGLPRRHAAKLRAQAARVATPTAACPGHAECDRCDVTDPCPCCGLRYMRGRWVTADGTETHPTIHNPQVITLGPVDNQTDTEGDITMSQPTALSTADKSIQRVLDAAREPERQRADQAEAALARVQAELDEAAELDDLTTGELADRIREAMAARP